MERNCLRLARHDRKSEQIAHALGIAPSTVNSHIFAARRKMGGITRLSAADQLRAYEVLHIGSERSAIAPDSLADRATAEPPHPLSRQSMWMAGDTSEGAVQALPTDVLEEETTSVFDDAVVHPGGQEWSGAELLHRVLLLLAIIALTALILIAAPAIYDSAAERIANSFERPHAR
jgi:DNA-binding CsgD family transcriptional regulator